MPEMLEEEEKVIDIKTKALATIEGLTLGRFKADSDIVEACFRFSHIALGQCRNPHKKWVAELNETHQKLIDNKIIEGGQNDKG